MGADLEHEVQEDSEGGGGSRDIEAQIAEAYHGTHHALRHPHTACALASAGIKHGAWSQELAASRQRAAPC